MDLQGTVPTHVQSQFEALAASKEIQDGSEPMSSDALVSGSSEVFKRVSARRAHTLTDWDNASSPKGHIFINGKYYVIDDVRSPTLYAYVSLYLQLITSANSARRAAWTFRWT